MDHMNIESIINIKVTKMIEINIISDSTTNHFIYVNINFVE